MEKESSSLPTMSDVEADTGIDAGSDGLGNTTHVHPRAGLATWRWILTCAVLYLGALLYGN